MAGVPRVGQEYLVEFDFNQPLRVGVNTKVTHVEASRIHNSEHQITLVARVEDVFNDNTASLRLGDSLILAEYEGAFPIVGTYVEVSVPQIDLFDTNV